MLFPTDVAKGDWASFRADGFSKPACGVVYRLSDTVTNGMPLGGVDTGCLDLETSGLWGYISVFNSLAPRRGPLNTPAFGLSVGGKTWVLCRPDPKDCHGQHQNGSSGKPVEPPPMDLKLDGVGLADEIHYWGHYPVADVEFETTAPVSVGVRAWSPFCPGDVVSSMIPGAVFEAHIRNTSGSAQSGSFALSFPGPSAKESLTSRYDRKDLKGVVSGVSVTCEKASYVIGVIGKEEARFGGELGADSAAWAGLGSKLPAVDDSQPGSSAAVDFSLKPGESQAVRFVLAWSAPVWNGSGTPSGTGGNSFTHMYARHYPDAVTAAESLARNHRQLLKRVLAWQQVVYTDGKLPVWLRDSLVNILHLITETGLWAQKNGSLPDWVKPEDGLFGMDESPRDCPQIECIPCSFYGNIPLVYFFPELALSTLRGYKGYQDAEGSPPWVFGPYCHFSRPERGYQVTMNSACYIDMLDRYLMCRDADKSVLKEFYPSVKRATEFTMSLNKGPDGVISMPDHEVSSRAIGWETEWFEYYEWHGMVTHVGGVHMAQLLMAERMAKEIGDEEFARQCREWFDAGADSLESKLWNGDYYLSFWDEKTDKKCDLVFGYQLDGEWMVRQHGMRGVFPTARVKRTLETIARVNVSLTRYGAVNYAHADGMPLDPGDFPMRGCYAPYDFFSPELLMLGMTYMYDGQRDFGMELCRRCMRNIVVDQGITWDMSNIIRGDTGQRTFGADYYQNMVLWSLPSAIAGRELSSPTESGGLVERMVRAGKG